MDILHGISGLFKSTFGIDVVTSKQQLQRLTVCFKCLERNNQRCKKCGCFIRAKTRLINEKCPVGKW